MQVPSPDHLKVKEGSGCLTAPPRLLMSIVSGIYDAMKKACRLLKNAGALPPLLTPDLIDLIRREYAFCRPKLPMETSIPYLDTTGVKLLDQLMEKHIFHPEINSPEDVALQKAAVIRYMYELFGFTDIPG